MTVFYEKESKIKRNERGGDELEKRVNDFFARVRFLHMGSPEWDTAELSVELRKLKSEQDESNRMHQHEYQRA